MLPLQGRQILHKVMRRLMENRNFVEECPALNFAVARIPKDNSSSLVIMDQSFQYFASQRTVKVTGISATVLDLEDAIMGDVSLQLQSARAL